MDKTNNSANVSNGISPIEAIIEDFKQGKMVILVDDEDRENEGDLIIAADDVDAAAINFMASYGRGLICLTLTQAHCQKLNLPLMTSNNNARYSTNFTVSIEASEGVTTGISAADRAHTIKAAVNPNGKADDIVMPGHIFPIMAQPGGVLTRAGHTEAGVDLARLGGKQPSSVICEILNADGTMARLPDLVEYSKTHGIKIGTIADLIRYRLENEPTVIRVSQQRIETSEGPMNLVAYHDTVDNQVHYALVIGDISKVDVVNVRVQVSTTLDDIISTVNHDKTESLSKLYRYMQAQGNGVMVLINYPVSARDVVTKFKQLAGDAVDEHDDSDDDIRVLGLGSQMLVDLGVKKMNVLGTARKLHALSGFGLEINEFIETF